MWIHCLVLISLKTSSAINWQTRIMLHSQARVIVLIMLPEMCLIKKKNAVFPEVLLQYLGGIRTEFIGINQTASHRNCSPACERPAHCQHARRVSHWMCVSLFPRLSVLFFHFTWNIRIYPSRSNTSLFSFCIVERKCWGTVGYVGTSVNCSLEENLSQWIYMERRMRQNLVTTKNENANYFSTVT